MGAVDRIAKAGKQVSIEELVRAFVRDAKTLDPKALCLDLGCGQRPTKGMLGVDVAGGVAGVVDADLYSPPWPFEDNSVAVVYASHFIEHIPDWDAFFTELYRVMQPDGRCAFLTPHESSTRMFQDPDHKQAISAERYLYLSKRWRQSQKMDHYGADVNFELEFAPIYEWHEDFRDKSDEAKMFALRHYRNAVSDIFVTLKVIKN